MSDKNLIFLISLPRSGSTLTQKIIGAHKDVYTRSEPWIMLNPLYSLKNKGVQAVYNKSWEYGATQDFITHLPGGRENYIEHLRTMYASLYSEYASEHKKIFFLDKTPRYFFVINELLEVFPDAKIVLLVRNPLAILSSIMNTWTKNNWSRLINFKADLVTGIDIIADEVSNNKKGIFILSYEEILADPGKVFHNCFEYLNLDFIESLLDDYAKPSEEKWLYGDQANVYSKNSIDRSGDTKWMKCLDDPQRWRVLYDYLHMLGRDKYDTLGYDFEHSYRALMDNIPAKSIEELEQNTTSLASLWEPEEERKERMIDQMQLEIKSLEEKNGHLVKGIEKIKSGRAYRLAQIATKPFQGM